MEWDSLTLVKEGYDPSVLPRKQNGLEALTGFVSNEPNLLKAAGDDVTVWQPVDYGIPSSIGAMAVNPAFAKAHPTAVEDVLRAALHAYDFCSSSAAKTKQCVGYAAKLSGATYDEAQKREDLDDRDEGHRGQPDAGPAARGHRPRERVEARRHAAPVRHREDLVTADDAKRWFTNEYIDAITKDGETVWPAP